VTDRPGSREASASKKLIIGERHNNLEVPRTWGRDKRKTNFDMLGFFLKTLYILFHVKNDVQMSS
jgi:hypothetical protein